MILIQVLLLDLQQGHPTLSVECSFGFAAWVLRIGIYKALSLVAQNQPDIIKKSFPWHSGKACLPKL